jgi:hypothetical protein
VLSYSRATYNFFRKYDGLKLKLIYLINSVYLFTYLFIHVLRVNHKSMSMIFLQKIKDFSFKWKHTSFLVKEKYKLLNVI